MTLPQLMVKTWTGTSGEFFTFRDMNRVEYNANVCAREAGVAQVTFQEVTRASQFRYDEAQKLEDLLKATAQAKGLSIDTETAWSYNRTVSYADFERWESNLWTIYQSLGGVGERIPSDKVLVNYHSVLFANAWQGTGPYHIDLDMPGIYADTEAMVFVTHTATVQQRMAEYNAVLRTEVQGDRRVRFRALSLCPKVDIPVTVAIGGLQMIHTVHLPASGWTGIGPWTQTVTLPSAVTEAVIGPWEGMSDSAVEQMMEGMLHVSSISGQTATIRVIGKRPTVDLNPALLYDTTNIA